MVEGPGSAHIGYQVLREHPMQKRAEPLPLLQRFRRRLLAECDRELGVDQQLLVFHRP